MRNNLIYRIIDNVDYISEFTNFIFHFYKEHNCLDLFYSQNCLYVKRFLYMYCREEKPSEKVFIELLMTI